MNPGIVRTILSKELLDTLRDKRTIIMMIGVPLLLYPALTLITFQGFVFLQGRLDETPSRVALMGTAPGPVEVWVRTMPRIELVDAPNPMDALLAGGVDAVVHVGSDAENAMSADRQFELTVRYDATEMASRAAANRLQHGLTQIMRSIRKERLDALGIREAEVTPFQVLQEDIAPPMKTTGTLVGALLPLLMVLMVAMGAFYPAVDLTAGEKERGTFETLLSTPVAKLEIVSGKFLAVFVLAMASGLLNLASMGLTFAFIFTQVPAELQHRLGMEFSLPMAALLVVPLIMLPLAFFISAAVMSIAVLARTFKEAQNLLTPFLLIIILPALVSAFPGASLDSGLKFLPIGNVALLFKELLIGGATLDEVFLVFISTAVLAVLALLFAAWLFQREDVVLSEDRGLPITLRRGRFQALPALPAGAALGFFAVVLLLIFYIGSISQYWDLVGGLLFTEWGLLFLPTIGFLWFVRVNLVSGLHWRPMSGRQWAGAALVAFGWPPVIVQLMFWANHILPVPEDYFLEFARLLEDATARAGLPLMFVALAVSPAICEEVLFRGAILSAFRQRMGETACILAVAFLFGVFHLSIYRFLPTAISGALLTYLVLRTGSIFASMLTHAFLNAAVFAVQSLPAPASAEGWLDPDRIAARGLPMWLPIVGLLLCVAGVAIIEHARAHRTPKQV